MTWSVSASGPKADVAKRVVEQVASHPLVAEGLVKIIEDHVGPHISISGTGTDTYTSVSISSFEAPVSAG